MKRPDGESEFREERSPLTGVYWRAVFLQRAKEFLSEPHEGAWCLAAIDIKNFKLFNEWYGQDAGNQVLRNIGEYFTQLQEQTHGVVGYFSGDDFYAIIPNDHELIERMHGSLSSFVESYRHGNVFQPAIGVYPIEDATVSVSTMCDMAQLTVASVKEDYRRQIGYYDNKLFRQLEKGQNLLVEVQRALQNEEFCFYLQPKCNMTNSKIISFEALVRWIHPEMGMVPPGEYIPFMEKSGLITELDLYVWEAVCIQICKWRDAGIQPIPISVNVSVADVFAIDVPQVFIDLVQKYDIDPRYIIVEITESAYVENFDTMKANIEQFQRHGFIVSMDDFGSGYSSLNMLKDINVDIVKLDMKFLCMDESNEEKGNNILSSIIHLVNVLNIRMIAEGVEAEFQVNDLLKMGCSYGQGYYFYRPLPVEEAEKLLFNRAIIDERGIDQTRFNQFNMADLIGKGVVRDHILQELLGPTIICEVQNGEFRALTVNEGALDVLKLSLQEIEKSQKEMVDGYFGGKTDTLISCFETAYQNKPNRSKFVVKGKRRNGVLLWLELKICCLQERDKWRMFLMNIRDVTPILSKDVQQKEYKNSFDQLLKSIATYYGGNRAYVFKFNFETQTCSNTYEWCAPGATSEIENLQDIPLEVVDDWVAEFERIGEFCIRSFDAGIDPESAAYKILKAQNIESLVTAPLKIDDQIIGFVGVDDPSCNEFDLTLLRTVTDFISSISKDAVK